MIVFSAIVPHSPILIPTIGKEHSRFVEKTRASLDLIAKELYATKPDTILLISPHGSVVADAFSINLSPQYTISFAEFGDLASTMTLTGDVGLAHHMKEKFEGTIPVVLTNQPTLDHGSSVPLYMLLHDAKGQDVKIIPLSYSLLPLEAHYQFGMKLQEDIVNETKRIAIIASGELSSRSKKESPAGYSAWAEKFDQDVIKKIQAKDFQGLLKLDPQFVEEVQECGLRSFAIFFGILNSINVKPQILSYEAPFGTGYVSALFQLP